MFYKEKSLEAAGLWRLYGNYIVNSKIVKCEGSFKKSQKYCAISWKNHKFMVNATLKKMLFLN